MDQMYTDQTTTNGIAENEYWLALLDAYDVQYLLLDRRRDSGLLHAARSRSTWILDFEDDDAVLFVRGQTPCNSIALPRT